MDAASITPAQKPMTMSFHLCGNSLIANPIALPINVAPHSPAALSQICVMSLLLGLSVSPDKGKDLCEHGKVNRFLFSSIKGDGNSGEACSVTP